MENWKDWINNNPKFDQIEQKPLPAPKAEPLESEMPDADIVRFVAQVVSEAFPGEQIDNDAVEDISLVVQKASEGTVMRTPLCQYICAVLVKLWLNTPAEKRLEVVKSAFLMGIKFEQWIEYDVQ